MGFSILKHDGDDLNPLLAENYARYGSLLLRVAIQNNDQNVLSSTNAATAGTPETTDALLKAASGDKKKLIEFSGDGDEDEEDGEEDAQNQENDNEAATPEDAEEEDDFTIAWENLDVARLLFEKRIDSCSDKLEESTLNRALAFVYQDLGDLSLENGILRYNAYILANFLENFAESITEYELALKHFGTPSTEHLRDVAGIYFNLALALEFENKIPESKEQYRHAKEVLQQKEAHILANSSSDDEKASGNSLNTPELSELRGLIGEITLKIEDLDTNNQSTMSKELHEATNKAALAAAQSLNGSVNDLSGMIKKRKAEPIEAASGSAKEVKIEEAVKAEAKEDN